MASPAVGWKPESQAEKEAVRQQLERVLAHVCFRNSRRCPNFLRYVVEATLRGEGEHLKERVVGARVFGRDPDYDTNLDPIVRTTAGEVRKRIAQYYHESGNEGELRIDLPPGSYAPQFHPAPERISTEAPLPPPAARVFPGRLTMLAAGVAAAALLVGFGTFLFPSRSAIGQFWAPVLVCIGQPAARPGAEAPGPVNLATISVSEHIRTVDHVVLADAIALSRLTGYLGRNRRDFRIQGALSATFSDLRQGPTVLISGMDNPWTRRLTEGLRFHFVQGPGRGTWIEDRKNPSRQDWLLNFSEPYAQVTQDYAIVGRFSDATTGQSVVVAAGIGENGTIAAGEFVTSPAFLEGFAKTAPAGWQRKNLEIVLTTEVIDGKTGPPRIIASHVW